MRNVFAGLLFVLLYGVAVRTYTLLRARRDSTRWHVPALFWSALLGGAAFYVAQQIRQPHLPTLLEAPAFAILCMAGSAIPVVMELGTVLPARLARRGSIRVGDPVQRGSNHEPS